MATDFVQIFAEAIVAALDTHASIIAITGRDTDNIVAGEATKEVELPIIAYDIINTAELAADQDTREPRVQFSADADDSATIRELLGVIERVLDQPLFASLTVPLDAQVINRLRIGDQILDVTFRVTQALPVAA